MPIELDKVVGKDLPDTTWSWDADTVILYHLGLGAGVPPTDDGELEYTYEARLKVLPSFGVLPVFDALFGMVTLDGIQINPMMLLHGEQGLTIHKPLPTAATVSNKARIEGVYDKGKGALIVVDTESRDEAGDLLATNRFSAFVRGEGGFGGPSGPAPGNEAPDRQPDAVAESPTMVQQALLYRLSGDKNPLHADPNMAALGGFDRPILHGLCSYGIVCKAVVDTMLDGDVTAVTGYDARFSGVVFPGETIVTRMWREGDRIIVSAATKERDSTVITNAAVRL
jgi:acyl dehydratase